MFTTTISCFCKKSIFEFIRRCHVTRYNYVMGCLRKSEEIIRFRCNICGANSSAKLFDVCDREKPSCSSCGSSLRTRAIGFAIAKEIVGEERVLSELAVNKSISGIGLSDWAGYAEVLREKFSYTNTFYHQDPLFDITNISSDMKSEYDFIVSSDVFEHVSPPIGDTFKNSYDLLKSDGVLILTVPYMHFSSTLEHFPDLYDYEIMHTPTDAVLLNTTKTGTKQKFKGLTFHGGKGATLEMRIFTYSSLIKGLKEAGFTSITCHHSTIKRFGIIWPVNWSLPITARKP